MRRKGHPSFPSAMTCCFFSSLKTLLMPTEPIRALVGVNVPGLPMAGFQLTLHGRIWVTPEGTACVPKGGSDPRLTWAAASRKSGFAPAQFDFFPRPLSLLLRLYLFADRRI